MAYQRGGPNVDGYGRVWGTPSATTVGTSTTEVFSANAGRRYMILSNPSDERVYFAWGQDAVQGQGWFLEPGVIVKLSSEDCDTGALNAICASGSKSIGYQEGT